MTEIHRIINTPVSSNCFLVFSNSIAGQCIVIDPGSEDNTLLLESLSRLHLQPEYILLTHEHFDHCWGVNELRRRFSHIQLVCTAECSKAIQDRKKNYSVFYRQPGFDIDAADIEVHNNVTMNLGGFQVDFTLAQGHSASGMMITIDNYIFTGDELIKDVKTVTKLKTGSKEKLRESFAYLRSLKGRQLTICPGHGDTFEWDSYMIAE